LSARLKKQTLDPVLVSGQAGIFRGKFRTIIEVEIKSIDDQPFTTNMNEVEAIRKIYIGALGLDKEELIGVQSTWKGVSLVSFRVSNPIDIDSLLSTFCIERKIELDTGEEINQSIRCNVRGVNAHLRNKQNDPKPRQVDDNVRMVYFDKVGWKLDHEKIKKWMLHFGDIIGEVTEQPMDGLPEDCKPKDKKVGSGNFRVLIKLKRPIPQFLPMYGYKIKVYYRDIEKVCTKCFRPGHLQNDCQNQQKEWLHEVVDFIQNNEQIDDELFGRWLSLAREYIEKNEAKFADNNDVALVDEVDDIDEPSSDESNSNDFSDAIQSPTSPKTVKNKVEKFEKKDKSSNKKSNNKKETNSKSQPTGDKSRGRGRPPKTK